MARTKQRVARRVEADLKPRSPPRPMDVDETQPSSAGDGQPAASSQVVDRVTVVLGDHGDGAGADPNVKVSVYAVNFPGYVSEQASSTTSVMRTMGGLLGLQEQRQAHPKQLKVKLRPDDPYCHPVIGTTKKSTNVILLRLACETPGAMEGVESMEGIDGSAGAGETDTQVHPPLVDEAGSSVVQVDELYSFKQPADLQLDSLTRITKLVDGDRDGRHAEGSTGGVRGEVGMPSGNGTLAVSRKEQKLACVPAVFLVEGAAEYGVDTYGAGRESGVPSYLATRGSNEIIVDYGVSNLGQLVKDDGIYYEASFKDTDSRLSPVGHALRKIFLERPVYAGAPLVLAVTSKMNGVVFSDTDANEQLSKLCYRFSSGPWRGCWVRKGYDPRKDSQAGKYQVVTLTKMVETHSGRGGTNGGTATAATAATAAMAATTGTSDTVWSNADDYDALCSLDATRITQYPARIQMMDIKDADVLGRLKQGSGKQCHRETGWQTASEAEQLCARISTVLGESSGVCASASEAEEIRMLPFSTIRSFGANTAPILDVPRKRGDQHRRDHGDQDHTDDHRLFDILPEEYRDVIQKLGLTTTKN